MSTIKGLNPPIAHSFVKAAADIEADGLRKISHIKKQIRANESDFNRELKSSSDLNLRRKNRVIKNQAYGLDQRNNFQYKNNKFGQAMEQQNQELLRDVREDQMSRADDIYIANQNRSEEHYQNQDIALAQSKEQIQKLEESLDQLKSYQKEQERLSNTREQAAIREQERLRQDYETLLKDTEARYQERLALNSEANAQVFEEIEGSSESALESLKRQQLLEKQELMAENQQELRHTEEKYLNFLARQDAEHRREIDDMYFKAGTASSDSAAEHQKELDARERADKERIAHVQRTTDEKIRRLIDEHQQDKQAMINSYNHQLSLNEDNSQEKLHNLKNHYERRIAEMHREFEVRRVDQNVMDREAIDEAYRQASKGYTKSGDVYKPPTSDANYQTSSAKSSQAEIANYKNSQEKEKQAMINAYNNQVKAVQRDGQQKNQSIRDYYERRISKLENEFENRRTSQNTMNNQAIDEAYRQNNDSIDQKNESQSPQNNIA